MIVTAWILFIFFGFMTLVITSCIFDKKVKRLNMRMYIFSIFMVAITAGVIWGGLFQ